MGIDKLFGKEQKQHYLKPLGKDRILCKLLTGFVEW